MTAVAIRPGVMNRWRRASIEAFSQACASGQLDLATGKALGQLGREPVDQAVDRQLRIRPDAGGEQRAVVHRQIGELPTGAVGANYAAVLVATDAAATHHMRAGDARGE